MPRAIRSVLFGIGVSILSGCYNYVPVQNPAPRTEVRITVPITSAVQNPNRAPESYTVEGIVVSSGDSLVLTTESRTEIGAYRQVTRTDTVRVATGSLLAVDERVFSRGKTIGLTVVVTAGVVSIVTGLLSVVTGEDGGGEGNGPPTQGQIRLDPIFGGILKLVGK